MFCTARARAGAATASRASRSRFGRSSNFRSRGGCAVRHSGSGHIECYFGTGGASRTLSDLDRAGLRLRCEDYNAAQGFPHFAKVRLTNNKGIPSTFNRSCSLKSCVPSQFAQHCAPSALWCVRSHRGERSSSTTMPRHPWRVWYLATVTTDLGPHFTGVTWILGRRRAGAQCSTSKRYGTTSGRASSVWSP